jgi:SSS family solute:Na+ symporter
MIIMLVIVITYTILGGMFSVIVTDYMQFIVLSFGLMVATIIVIAKVDISSLSDAVSRQFGEGGFNPIAHPRFGWVFLLWVFVTNLAAAALWQPGMSKALAAESPSAAKKVFFYTSLTFAGRAIIPMFLGIAALTLLGPGESSTGATPKLLGSVLPSGLLGLLVAGMLAASMSTYSAYLLAWSSVAARDVIGCLRKSDFEERTTMLITRVVAGLIGMFLLFFGLWYQIPDTAYQYLFITGAMYTAGALSVVAAGIYWKKANSTGAHAALILGAIGPAGFLILENFRDSIPDWLVFLTDVNISGLLSFALAAAGMVGGSMLGQRHHSVEKGEIS